MSTKLSLNRDTVERDAKKLMGEVGPADDRAYTSWHAERWKLRREKSLPVLDEFHRWLSAPPMEILPKSPAGQARAYVLPRWDGLTRYCERGFLEIDNNLSERMIRPCTLGRKNYLFLGSDNGGRAAAVLYSIIANCKANQVEPFAYVREVLHQIAQDKPENLDRFLSDLWLASHPNARRKWSR